MPLPVSRRMSGWAQSWRAVIGRGRRLPEAAPLLTVLTDAGDEVLIPYVQAFLVALAPEHKRIDMALPAGLIDLNRAPGGE